MESALERLVSENYPALGWTENPPINTGDIRDVGSTPGSERSPGGGHGTPLQCSCLENPRDRGAWPVTVHRAAKGRTCLNQLSTWIEVHFLAEIPIIDHKLFW